MDNTNNIVKSTKYSNIELRDDYEVSRHVSINRRINLGISCVVNGLEHCRIIPLVITKKISTGDKGKTSKENYIYAYVYINKHNKIKYICIGSSYISYDGDYKKYFVDYYSIDKMMEFNAEDLDINEIFKGLNEITINQIKHKDFSWDNSHLDIDDKNFVENKQLNMKCYNVLVLFYYYYYKKNINEDNVHQFFKNIVDTTKYDQHISFRPEVIERMIFSYQSVNSPKDAKINKRLFISRGQKIIPITKEEFNNMYDIRYKIWKELFIMKELYKVLPCSISIPLLHDYDIIKPKYDIINNPIIKTKIVSGTSKRKKILSYLDKLAISSRSLMRSKKEKIENEAYSEYFLVTIAEDLGYSLHSVLMQNKSLFTKNDYMAKMFDLVYSLYVLNTKLGVIQGDLHLGNVILGNSLTTSISKAMKKLSPELFNNLYYSYKLDGRKFLFPFNNVFLYPIDFSRSIIFNDEDENIFHSQRKLIKEIMLDYFPEFMAGNNLKKFKIKLLENFADIFKIISAIDPYIFFSKFKELLSSDIFKKKKESNDLIDFFISHCNKIIDISKNYLENILLLYINDKIDTKMIEWANFKILTTCFDSNYLTASVNYMAFEIDYDTFSLPDEFCTTDMGKERNLILEESDGYKKEKEEYIMSLF